jgi:hypothetical protein
LAAPEEDFVQVPKDKSATFDPIDNNDSQVIKKFQIELSDCQPSTVMVVERCVWWNYRAPFAPFAWQIMALGIQLRVVARSN